MSTLVSAVEASFVRQDLPTLESGDTVRVHAKVVEGAKERIQVFEGIVIALRGAGLNKAFTVRRLAQNIGVERTFLLNSPRIDKIEVLKHAVTHRKNLYFLRGLTGKAARLKERRR
jgi:large subunit ribosomal protein L19